MNEKQRSLRDIHRAIDQMDLPGIEQGLDSLAPLTGPIEAEDPMLFAARIKTLHKERIQMKKPRHFIRAAVVAAAVLLMGVGAYAANAVNLFSFSTSGQGGDQLITLRTTDQLTEGEARELVEGDASGQEAEPPTDTNEAAARQPQMQSFDFATTGEAAQAMDMVVLVPAAAEGMELADASGQIVQYGEEYERRTLWLNYADEAGRLFGVTTSRNLLSSGAEVTAYTAQEIDPDSAGSYTTPGGVTYQLAQESDDSGERTAHIAQTVVGEYEYALVFFQFEEAERQAVLDTLDLSPLR